MAAWVQADSEESRTVSASWWATLRALAFLGEGITA